MTIISRVVVSLFLVLARPAVSVELLGRTTTDTLTTAATASTVEDFTPTAEATASTVEDFTSTTEPQDIETLYQQVETTSETLSTDTTTYYSSSTENNGFVIVRIEKKRNAEQLETLHDSDCQQLQSEGEVTALTGVYEGYEIKSSLKYYEENSSVTFTCQPLEELPSSCLSYMTSTLQHVTLLLNHTQYTADHVTEDGGRRNFTIASLSYKEHDKASFTCSHNITSTLQMVSGDKTIDVLRLYYINMTSDKTEVTVGDSFTVECITTKSDYGEQVHWGRKIGTADYKPLDCAEEKTNCTMTTSTSNGYYIETVVMGTDPFKDSDKVKVTYACRIKFALNSQQKTGMVEVTVLPF